MINISPFPRADAPIVAHCWEYCVVSEVEEIR